MLRTIVTVVTVVAGGMAWPAAVAVERPPPDVDVRIAKTAHYVRPFGTVEPAQRGNRVAVRLFRFADGRWVHRDTQRVEITIGDDVDGDGAANGTYRARFRRPRSGLCRVVAALVGSDTRDVDEFPCYIPDFPSGTATLSKLTESVEIRVLIAETDEHRQYGLMYRPRLPRDLGMAFLWAESNEGGFWMKNTLVPLSIAFFDSEGVILRIMDMEPCLADDTSNDCESYDPGVSYHGALEVNQGAFKEWDISAGDQIDIHR